MEAVQHPQIHLSRTSPLGAQCEGTTAQIGIPLTHPAFKVHFIQKKKKITTITQRQASPHSQKQSF